MPFIRVEEKLLPFRLRRSQRAKRLHLVSRGDVFELVAPPSIPNKVLLRFAWDQRAWMAKQWTRKTFLFPSFLWSEVKIPFQGRNLLLEIRTAPCSKAYLDQERLVLALPEPSQNNIKKLLKTWYLQKAEAHIQASIAYFCPRLGCWPKDVQLKQQKTRWGSCGIQQKIYLNWLLVLAPSGVLEYVVLHELCHLLHRNHGSRFWKKVATCLPDYKVQEAWLKEHGGMLLAFSL